MAQPHTSDQKTEILASRLSELPRNRECSLQAKLTEQLYSELEARGLSFRPRIYLSNEWGCPDGVPVIGIPFYLASDELCQLVAEASSCPVEDEAEMMLYLRHEAGHAFSYAYKLEKESAWQKVFGLPEVPYPHHYLTRPFSPHYVRHIAGWYAQKHPDEDFAESFAVWLKPDSNWRERYKGTPAMEKLLYVEDVARRLGKAAPRNIAEDVHMPVEEMRGTLGDWCRARGTHSASSIRLPEILASDLGDLLPSKEGVPAYKVLEDVRSQLLCQIHAWTGLDSDLLHALLQRIGQLVRRLNLKVPPEGREAAVIKLTVFATTLAMNYQKTGRFVEE